LGERARVLPESETNTVMIWSSTKVEDNSKDDEAGDGKNLDRGEDEFGFAVCASTEPFES